MEQVLTRQPASAAHVAASVLVAPEARAVRGARAFVAGRCARGGVAGDVRDDAVLLASELVTEALRRGARPTRLSVAVSPAGVHLALREDPGGRRRAPGSPGALRAAAPLLDALTTAWGVHDAYGSRLAWACLAR